MNNLFFACRDCRIYINAGNRWSYWQLEEPGIVSRNKPVNVGSVLAAQKYWAPPKDESSRWLYEEVLPTVGQFLLDHKGHQITFGEEDEFVAIENDDYFDWMQIGYLAKPTPRYLVEILAFTAWDQVLDYMHQQKVPPAWWEVIWMEPSSRERGKKKFEELVRQKRIG